jgi:Holliday junction resolvasome RuvABC ATP-dependent DNA helicase subunit
MKAPNRKITITLLRRIRDTTEIRESGHVNALKYRKSAMARKTDMSGIFQFHRRAVVFLLIGNHKRNSTGSMIRNW